jgi:hypothetical protein
LDQSKAAQCPENQAQSRETMHGRSSSKSTSHAACLGKRSRRSRKWIHATMRQSMCHA